MLAILGAVLLLAVAVMEVLLILGLPLGEYTMGGRHKVLPGPYRIAAASSILIQIFGALMMLQGAGFMNMWFGLAPTKVICFVFGGFFAINTVMNFISPSKKEKYVMTPLALIEAVCFIVTAVKM
ncbi:hypothetical protein B0O40_1212 [Ruminococcaceae bacterium R-25]|nr:hypothetical protein B0O40_1212 [Ruminococcaceae bacterium R-25]SUQ11822.1 hypothetical protein SAMN06297423_1212 [Oscillospiraceae bacterium]